jgi:hypothetical protein
MKRAKTFCQAGFDSGQIDFMNILVVEVAISMIHSQQKNRRNPKPYSLLALKNVSSKDTNRLLFIRLSLHQFQCLERN